MEQCLTVTVELLTPESAYLERVLALHRAEKHRLGMMPRGAFVDYSRQGKVLIALDERHHCVGYLLYRAARERAIVVHLSSDLELRYAGVTRPLIERLKEETRHLQGIGLYCRRDYGLAGLWQKHGFHPVASKAGRGKDREELTFWWFSHNHPNLFSIAQDDGPDDLLSVAIDANVFYDLFDNEEEDREECRALLADWLKPSIELFLTPEIYSEINRADQQDRRKRSLENVAKLKVLANDSARFERLLEELAPRFPGLLRESDKSDMRQIAHAIAADVEYFVTRDGELRDRCEGLYESHGLTILSPTDLINRLDSLQREQDYQPARLAGSQFRSMLLRSEHEESVVAAFQQAALGESRKEFAQTIHRYLSQPDRFECRVAFDRSTPMVLQVVEREEPKVWRTHLLRVARGPLSATLARHFLDSALRTAALEGREVVIVTEPYVSPVVKSALGASCFSANGSRYAKYSVIGVRSWDDLTARFPGQVNRDEGSSYDGIPALLGRFQHKPTLELALEIEKRLWPVKLAEADIPSFIVPIQPSWAAHFFDEETAAGLLFGAREDRCFNAEGVYYRSNQACGLSAPGRILWYVSKGADRRFPGHRSVVACSQLDEIVVDRPKPLFARFRRLGVYEWKDVFATAEGDLSQKVMALRFSRTERFPIKVGWQRLNALDIASPFVSPRPVTSTQFAAVHRLGYSAQAS